MEDKNQQQAARVEQEAAGRGGLDQSELDELVASSDTGGRTPGGITEKFLLGVALVWSLFQLWIASPIPFIIGFGVFNDTEARSIHLAFAVLLAFLAYPAARSRFQLVLGIGIPALLGILFVVGGRGAVPVWLVALIVIAVAGAVVLGSPKDRVPVWEWALAIAGAFCAVYLYANYVNLSQRPGAPIFQDLVIGMVGIMLLLEATRRSLGPALMIVASVFLLDRKSVV